MLNFPSKNIVTLFLTLLSIQLEIIINIFKREFLTNEALITQDIFAHNIAILQWKDIDNFET